MSEARTVAPEVSAADGEEATLRPRTLSDFTGQRKVCNNLRVFIAAAAGRAEALDHVMLSGPPGLGKTTLAQIIARELGVGFHATSGPVILRSGDLAAVLTNLQPRDVLFIDEMHRLQPAVEEILYPAMEDFQLDLMIGEGPGARSVRIDLPPFTLIGATTRTGLITNPLRERFGIPLRLDFYDVEELERALEYPWDRWAIFLHPSQRRVVEQAFSGPARVSGSAGTGKTVVALHRAAALFGHGQAGVNPFFRILGRRLNLDHQTGHGLFDASSRHRQKLPAGLQGIYVRFFPHDLYLYRQEA